LCIKVLIFLFLIKLSTFYLLLLLFSLHFFIILSISKFVPIQGGANPNNTASIRPNPQFTRLSHPNPHLHQSRNSIPVLLSSQSRSTDFVPVLNKPYFLNLHYKTCTCRTQKGPENRTTCTCKTARNQRTISNPHINRQNQVCLSQPHVETVRTIKPRRTAVPYRNTNRSRDRITCHKAADCTNTAHGSQAQQNRTSSRININAKPSIRVSIR